MDDNTEIFQDFWKNYTWPEQAPVFYRLYYDDLGHPITYSMDELPGNYIDITPEQLVRAEQNVLVKNGKIIEVAPPAPPKLQKSDVHGTCCDPRDVAVVVTSTQPHQQWHYARNTIN